MANHLEDDILAPSLVALISTLALAQPTIAQPLNVNDELHFTAPTALLDDYLNFQFVENTTLTTGQPIPGIKTDDEVLPLTSNSLLDDHVLFQWNEPPLAIKLPYISTSAEERSFVIYPPLDEDPWLTSKIPYTTGAFTDLTLRALSVATTSFDELDDSLASLQLQESHYFFLWMAGTSFTDQQPYYDANDVLKITTPMVDDDYNFVQLTYAPYVPWAQPDNPITWGASADSTGDVVPAHHLDEVYTYTAITYTPYAPWAQPDNPIAWGASAESTDVIGKTIQLDDFYVYTQLPYAGSAGVQPDSPIALAYGAFADSTGDVVPQPVPFWKEEEFYFAQAQLSFTWTQYQLQPYSINEGLQQLFFYYTLGQAEQILADAGFTISPVILWQYSSVVPYYYVISQLPTSGTVILYQSQPVQLTVSAGPAPPTPELVSVPILTGMPLLFALELISSNSLNIGTVSYQQSAIIPVNQVVAQSVASGTLVEQFTGVNLTVCSGPPMDTLFDDDYTVPDVSGPQV